MLVVTRDADWELRLKALCVRGRWDFVSCRTIPAADQTRETVLVVVDNSHARSVGALRAHHSSASVVLALASSEMTADTLREALASGADEVLGKDWSDEKLRAKIAAYFDRALAADVRVSGDGTLKAELRSHRAYVSVRDKWKDLKLHPAEFALLWRLLAREGQAVSREELLGTLKSALNRDFEAETVARRALTLRKALRSWKGGKIESVRGGFYRLVLGLP